MLKITDRFKLDGDEVKRALMEQTDEYRMQFDKLLSEPGIAENDRLAGLRFIANQSAAIFTFLAIKAGIDIRTEEGGMLADRATGYYQAKIADLAGVGAGRGQG